MENQVLSHLFRSEYRKLTTVLTRLFGFGHIEIAEDIVSDTFLLASETWAKNPMPNNPAAWLYAVAKNKAKDHLKRQTIFTNKVSPAIKIKDNDIEAELDLSEKNINDSQLQ